MEGVAITSLEVQLSHHDVVTSGKIEIKRFRIWKKNRTIELESQTKLPIMVESCCTNVLGQLVRPVSFRAKLSNGKEFLITIPSHHTFFYGSKNNGGVIQIDIKGAENLGGIVLDPIGSNTNNQEVLSQYALVRKKIKQLLSSLKNIKNKDFIIFRKIYARIISHELIPSEKSSLLLILSEIPKDERPIRTYNIDRFLIDNMNQRFAINLDSMNDNEFISAFNATFSRAFEKNSKYDETYMFRILEKTGINKLEQFKLLRMANETQIAYIKEMSSRGISLQNMLWNNRYIFEMSFVYLKALDIKESEVYLEKIKVQMIEDNDLKYLLKDFYQVRRILNLNR